MLQFFAKATLALLACLSAYQIVFKRFTVDEMEAIHTAWKISAGETIYTGFFQHHHPLLYFYLAPVIVACGARPMTLIACRAAMVPFILGTVWCTYALAGRVFGRSAAILTLIFLLASRLFLRVGVEVRPDVPLLCFGMAAILLAFPKEGAPPRRTLASWLSGICLGLSLLFLQKAIFFIAPVWLLMAWPFNHREAGSNCGHRFSGLRVSFFPSWLGSFRTIP